MDEVIRNIRILSSPVQKTSAYEVSPQDQFLLAQANLERFIDENAVQWPQFFDQIQSEQAAT